MTKIDSSHIATVKCTIRREKDYEKGYAIRLSAIFLVSVLLLSVFNVSALNGEITEDKDNGEIIEIVEEFLNARARNEWLYEYNDLTRYILNVNPLGSLVSKNIFSTHMQTFLDIVDMTRSHRIFVGKINTDFKTSYAFTSIITRGNEATVSVYESVTYLISNGNGMPTFIGTDFTVTLTKAGSTWFVSDIDIADDFLYGEYKDTGINKSAIAEIMRDFVLGIGEEMTLSVDGESLLIADQTKAVTSATTLVSYNAAVAVDYANVFSDEGSGTSGTYYNTNFYNFNASGGDCANFVNQCIWAGFGGDNSRANTTQYPKDTTGNYNWHCEKSPISYNGNWTLASGIGSYADAMGSAGSSEYGWYGSVYTLTDGNSLPSGVSFAGSAFLVYESGNYNHAIIITSASGNSPSNIYYNAHNNNHKNACLANNTSWTSHNIKIIVPTAFRRYNSSCSGHTYTSYSSGNGFDSTCNNCGESRMLFNFSWNTGAINTSKTLYAIEKNYNSCYRLELRVINASGSTLATFTDTSAASVLGSYTFTSAGLYTLQLKAWDSYSAYQASSTVPTAIYTYSVRIG